MSSPHSAQGALYYRLELRFCFVDGGFKEPVSVRVLAGEIRHYVIELMIWEIANLQTLRRTKIGPDNTEHVYAISHKLLTE